MEDDDVPWTKNLFTINTEEEREENRTIAIEDRFTYYIRNIVKHILDKDYEAKDCVKINHYLFHRCQLQFTGIKFAHSTIQANGDGYLWHLVPKELIVTVLSRLDPHKYFFIGLSITPEDTYYGWMTECSYMLINYINHDWMDKSHKVIFMK